MRCRLGEVMATDLAPVTPAVLRWARESVGASVDDAAKRAGVTEERIRDWEAGEAEPTLAKLRMLAKLYQRPLSVFFSQNHPQPSKRCVTSGEWRPAKITRGAGHCTRSTDGR